MLWLKVVRDYKKMVVNLKNEGDWMFGKSLSELVPPNSSNELLKIPDGFLVNEAFGKKILDSYILNS